MKKAFRFFIVITLVSVAASTMLTSCTRGYGCPYKTQVSAAK